MSSPVSPLPGQWMQPLPPQIAQECHLFLDGWCETSSHVSHVRMDETSSKHLQTLARIHHSWCLKSWPVFNINIFKMMLKKNRLGSMRLKKIPIYPIYLLVGGLEHEFYFPISWDDDPI
jgi:hypothetical protein